MALGLFPTDDVAPYFKTEPVRTQVHLEGNRLVLTCMAEGSWPLEFKWLHNNRELTKFSLEYRQASPSLPSPPFFPPGCQGNQDGDPSGRLRVRVPTPVLLGAWGGRSWGTQTALPQE